MSKDKVTKILDNIKARDAIDSHTGETDKDKTNECELYEQKRDQAEDPFHKYVYGTFAIQHDLNHHYNQRISELESKVQTLEIYVNTLMDREFPGFISDDELYNPNEK